MKSDFANLNRPNFRLEFEAESGIFIAEGQKVLERALALGYEPRTLLTTSKWLNKFESAQIADFDIELLAPEEIAEIVGYSVHRGVLASFNRKPVPTLKAVMALAGPLVLLENLVDLENIGTIFRTAAAMGISGILLGPQIPDPYYRRIIKASMGASLQLPYSRYASLADFAAASRPRPIIGLTLQTEISLASYKPQGNEILALGSEGDGLSADFRKLLTTELTIPMAAGVDSLNVAAAAAIGIWQLSGRV